MNSWMPKKLSWEFLNIQDEYLTEESCRKGITDLSQLRLLAPDNRLYLWQGDMTTLKVDGLALRYRCHEIMRAQGAGGKGKRNAGIVQCVQGH